MQPITHNTQPAIKLNILHLSVRELPFRCITKLVFVCFFTTIACYSTTNVAAQTELIGTGDPSIDVPAVQAAVNNGGDVLLKGTFSFTGVAVGSPHRVVTITNSVNLFGVVDENGDAPLIINGERPFLVAATGANVAFDGLQFQNPTTAAIWITSVGDLRIANCKFDGVVPGLIGTELVGITSGSVGGPFGNISVLNNYIDGKATATFSTNGVILTGATGSVEISGNTVLNTSAHGIDLRNIAGDAKVTGNQVITGQFGRGGGPGQFVDAIRCVGPGNYLIENNSLDFGYLNEAGVRLGGTTGAIVKLNKITGSVADDVVPGSFSAAIQVEGSCNENLVADNRFQGHARVVFSVVHSDFPLDKQSGTSGDPQGTSFIGNNHELFTSSLVDVEVGPVANQTTIVGGTGTIVDLGLGTIVKGHYETLSGDRYQSTGGVEIESSN